MKQETGKTNHTKIKNLSVQISLNGQVFSYMAIDGVKYGENYSLDTLIEHIAKNDITDLMLFIAQSKQATIPEELFLESKKETYLVAKYALSDGMILNDITDGIAVVYPMIENLGIEISELQKVCNVFISHCFSSLLTLTKKTGQDNISFSYIDNCIYVVANKQNKIMFIECFEIEEENNIIDIIEIISEKLNMKKASVLWIGELSKETSDILTTRHNIV